MIMIGILTVTTISHDGSNLLNFIGN